MSIVSSQTQEDELFKIFFEEGYSQLESIKAANTRFVHYTTAESAVNILRSAELWMRKSNTMNDFMEVEHGTSLLISSYNNFIKAEFEKLLEPVFPGFCAELESQFDGWLPRFRNDTYLACLSIHETVEDSRGRLSMWRAYGGNNGVALVLNNTPFVSESNALNVYSSCVSYAEESQFNDDYRKIIQRLSQNISMLSSITKDQILHAIFNKFLFSVLCTKHVGFIEEKEWRVFHNPYLWPSSRVENRVEIIRGIPQQVIKVPLKSYPDEGLHGVELKDLLERIIIGPTNYPVTIRDAFVSLLADIGVKDPQHKVVISGIPLRT